MTTVQDRYDEYQHIIDDQKKEIEVLENETARMTLDLTNTGLENERLSNENDHLKKLLEANGIAF